MPEKPLRLPWPTVALHSSSVLKLPTNRRHDVANRGRWPRGAPARPVIYNETTWSSSTSTARLALASYRQHKDRIDTRYKTIKRNIATRTPPNRQFSLAAPHRATDERTMGQDLYRLHDLARPRGCVLNLESGHVLEESIDVVKDLRREFDAGHAADLVQACEAPAYSSASHAIGPRSTISHRPMALSCPSRALSPSARPRHDGTLRPVQPAPPSA